jgi:chromosome segregation ATPase
MDVAQSPDLVIEALTRQFSAALTQRTNDLLGQAQAEASRLQEELLQERQRREQSESLLGQRVEQLQRLEDELLHEREARQRAEAEVATIHAAIAAQLDIAEAEQAALEEAEAQRQAELASLRQELTEERLRRDLLQHRVETVRRAAADLFGFDQPATWTLGSQASEEYSGASFRL